MQVNLSKAPNVAKELTELLTNFAEVVSELPIPYSQYVKAFANASKTVSQPKDIYKLKEEIEKILKQQKQKILIVIDDIDRLTAEEIRQLFRVIKAVANFPNVIYLLLFDKKVVIKALEEAQGIPGEDYLEKIVQVPFELPIPDQISLQRLLFEKLDVILSGTPQELFDQTHWGNVFLEGINEFIAKPRDIIRLTNTLSITYPAVEGEVNTVDFIAIESLRVFCPRIYNVIRNNPQVFTGKVYNNSTFGNSLTTLKPLLEKWISQLQEKEREPVRKLLERLFPKLKGNCFAGSWDSVWRKELRVCSLDIFPAYFRLALPEGNFSNTELQAILSLANDTNAFGEKLLELAKQIRSDGTTRVSTFLERLEDYTKEDISSESVPSIVQAFLMVGDELLRPEDKNLGMFDYGNDMRIGRILY